MLEPSPSLQLLTHPIHYSFIWAGCMYIAFLFIKPARASLLQVLPVVLIFTLFYQSHFATLLYWLRECTLGPLSSIGGGRHGRSHLNVIYVLSNHLFYLPSLPFVLFGAGLAIRSKAAISSLNPVIFTSVIIALSPFLTQNTAPRYYYPMVVALWITSFVIFFSGKKWWALVGQGAFLMTLVYNYLGPLAIVWPETIPMHEIPWHTGAPLRGINNYPDPARQMAQGLIEHFNENHPKKDAQIALIRAINKQDFHRLESWPVNTLLLRSNSKVRVTVPYGFDTKTSLPPEQILNEALKTYDYLLVGKMDDPHLEPMEPDSFIIPIINDLYKKKQLDRLGLIYEGEISNNSPSGVKLDFMILKISRPGTNP